MLASIGLITIVLLMPMMIVGLLVSLIQTASSVSEQVLSFVPKMFILRVCPSAFAGALLEV